MALTTGSPVKIDVEFLHMTHWCRSCLCRDRNFVSACKYLAVE